MVNVKLSIGTSVWCI